MVMFVAYSYYQMIVHNTAKRLITSQSFLVYNSFILFFFPPGEVKAYPLLCSGAVTFVLNFMQIWFSLVTTKITNFPYLNCWSCVLFYPLSNYLRLELYDNHTILEYNRDGYSGKGLNYLCLINNIQRFKILFRELNRNSMTTCVVNSVNNPASN